MTKHRWVILLLPIAVGGLFLPTTVLTAEPARDEKPSLPSVERSSYSEQEMLEALGKVRWYTAVSIWNDTIRWNNTIIFNETVKRNEEARRYVAPQTTGEYTPPKVQGPLPEGFLACTRQIESTNNYATDTGNGYYGAYQFDQQTWEGVGGTGNPAHASPEEQDARAAQLYAERGSQPWGGRCD